MTAGTVLSDPLLAFRGEFPILDSTTYLVSNSLGAMPRGVPDRLAEYVDQWAELGVRAWAAPNGWWHLAEGALASFRQPPRLGMWRFPAANGRMPSVPIWWS